MIARQFITIKDGIWGPRQVHYRSAGTGPNLLLLHQAPLSSSEMEPLIEQWSNHFTCIAPDHPGFGLSDPSGKAEVSMEELAASVLELLDALGIEQTAVYGVHTGACIGTALAALCPSRVWACVANGYVVVTPEEREDLLANYLPEMTLAADGSHLSWLWWRVREKMNFSPWYRAEADNRIKHVKPELAKLQHVTLEMLRSEDQYRIGYRAAFTFDAQSLLKKLSTPTLLVTAKQDPLAGHLQRVKQPPVCVQSILSQSAQQAEQDALSFLQEQAKSRRHGSVQYAANSISQRLNDHMVLCESKQLRVQTNMNASGTPILLLHDSIGSVDVVASISSSFIGIRPIICLDLPGQGESEGKAIYDEHYLDHCLSSVISVLNYLNITSFECVGIGSGNHLAIELQKRIPEHLIRSAMIDPICLDIEEKTKHLQAENDAWQPRWDGGHLMELWCRMRDEALVWPWFEPESGKPICQLPWLQNAHLHKRVVAFLKSPERTFQSIRFHATYPLLQALSESNQSRVICSAKWSPQYDNGKSITKRYKNLQFLELPDTPDEWGKAISQALDKAAIGGNRKEWE